MNEADSIQQPIQPSFVRRAIASFASAILGVGILFFGPFFTPSWLGSFSSYESDSTRLYWMLCWSQSIWEPIFPSPPRSSAPSGACYLAMLITDVVVAAVILFAFLTLTTRITNDRNA